MTIAPPFLDKDAKNIEEMNYVVQKALEMLLGAGGHKAGITGLGDAIFKSSTSLSNAFKVGMGVTLDHWHLGYKHITMDAFRTAIQKIAEHYFIAFKILEEENVNQLPETQSNVFTALNNPEDREHILKILGLTKSERAFIEKSIQTDINQNANGIEIAEIINNFISLNKEQKSDFRKKQIQKVEFMLNGAQCYLPFAEPNDGHRIKLPTKNTEGKYVLTEMEVEQINMSKGLEGPYYALNLRAIERNQYCQDITIFMGTNPMPTASGPFVTIHADSIPGMAVGENFVEGAKDQFENLFKQQFKENLEQLITQAKKSSNDINYEKIWLEARIKCVGQSLGGSIPLQMLSKFPYMVEIHAFEPPFLPEHLRNAMEINLINASDNFAKIVDELDLPGMSLAEKDALKGVVSKDVNKLKNKLKENNTIVTQLLDFVTKYGSVSPPAQIYHVDTDKQMPKYNKITDKIYKGVMAGTAMSHAMALGGQNDKVINKIDEEISQEPRQAFTNFLHKMVWKIVNPPLVAYFYLKHFYLKNIHNPKMNPSKNPSFMDKNKEILEQEIKGKWRIIQKNLTKANKNNCFSGQHLNDKFKELAAMIERADLLNLDTSSIKNEIQEKISYLKTQPNNLNTSIYARLLEQAILPPSTNEDIQTNIHNSLSKVLKEYVNNLQLLTFENQQELSEKLKKSRQKMLEYYPLLDKHHRRAFVSILKNEIENNNLLVSNPQKGLLHDLKYCAQSPGEKKALSHLIKKQEKQIHAIVLSSEIVKILNTDMALTDKATLNYMKNTLKNELTKYANQIDDSEMNRLRKRVLISKINVIEKQEKINEVFHKEPRPQKNTTFLHAFKKLSQKLNKNTSSRTTTASASSSAPIKPVKP